MLTKSNSFSKIAALLQDDVAAEMEKNKKSREKVLSKVQQAKKLLNKGIVKPKKTTFGDEDSEEEEEKEKSEPEAMEEDEEEHEGMV